MIYSLDIKDPSKTPISWLGAVPALMTPRRFVFNPGLNVLWGRNGSGKTTLIKLIATLLHCEQGSVPLVTHTSLHSLVGTREPAQIKSAIQLEHDGQGVRHLDAGHTVGLIGGKAAFDWDFGSEGISNVMFRGSAGETTIRNVSRIFDAVVRGQVPKVEWKCERRKVKPGLELADHFLRGNAKKGPPTVILDEPERSNDLNTEVGVWRFLRAFSPRVQFIVASHSLFALRIPEASYIELSPGYLDGSVKALAILEKWAEEKPRAPKRRA